MDIGYNNCLPRSTRSAFLSFSYPSFPYLKQIVKYILLQVSTFLLPRLSKILFKLCIFQTEKKKKIPKTKPQKTQHTKKTKKCFLCLERTYRAVSIGKTARFATSICLVTGRIHRHELGKIRQTSKIRQLRGKIIFFIKETNHSESYLTYFLNIWEPPSHITTA